MEVYDVKAQLRQKMIFSHKTIAVFLRYNIGTHSKLHEAMQKRLGKASAFGN
jgi:hypothetical protein